MERLDSLDSVTFMEDFIFYKETRLIYYYVTAIKGLFYKLCQYSLLLSWSGCAINVSAVLVNIGHISSS